MSNDENFITILAQELKNRNNPTNLKANIIGKVVQLEPLVVSISDGHVLLKENDHLEISEWFRFRCNIDKTKPFTSSVSTANKCTNEVRVQRASGKITLLPANVNGAI